MSTRNSYLLLSPKSGEEISFASNALLQWPTLSWMHCLIVSIGWSQGTSHGPSTWLTRQLLMLSWPSETDEYQEFLSKLAGQRSTYAKSPESPSGV